jgi:mono/diheme cytochrome c family protein
MLKPRTWLVVCGAVLVTFGYWSARPSAARLQVRTGSDPAGGPATRVTPPASLRPVLDRYCISCHNRTLKTAGVALDGLDLARIGDDAETWERVARKLRTHEMPPPGLPRPDNDTYDRAVSSLETALDAAATANPNPGRVIVHRLNRTEYTNAVRDLLALDIDGRALLPADEPDQQGFDNVAGVLSVSPRLLENYLAAAAVVSRLAVGDRSLGAVENTFKIPTALVQDDRTDDDLPFGSRGGISIPYQFPLDGEYRIKVLLRRQLYLYLIGMGEPHQIDIRLDGALIKRFTIGGAGKGLTAPESFAGNTQGDPDWEVYMHTADDGLTVSLPVTAGAHDVGVSFVRRHWEPEGILQPPQRGFARTTNELYFGNPAVDIVSIAGPYSAEAADDTPSRRAVFTCHPSAGGADEQCARTILSRLARRAYRRPVTERDLDTLLGFYRAGQAEEGFEAGIQRGLRRILASPSFLFRVEREPANVAAGTIYRVNDIDLASRLSFFLWSSIPDDELIDAAARGALGTPAGLEQQVRRMLSDDRAQALVDNFASQWLTVGKLSGVVPDVDAYPEFDENLRDAFGQETRLFVSSQLREDRGVGELLTANYTYVNERLARHYQIPNVYGSHFRRVTIADGRRGGLLGQGSILTVTSYPNRTSPVVRGRWLLENILGAPPPAPPPDVPSLQPAGADGRPRSIREQMEAHRKNPACAVCHVRMDPLGFSLENFDALGKWRTSVDAMPIDASAALPDGTQFEGVEGLRRLLANHQEDFARTFTQKLLAYALGRSVEAADVPAIRQITKQSASGGYRWSSLIMGIVKSTPFTMSTTRTPDPAPVSTAAP